MSKPIKEYYTEKSSQTPRGRFTKIIALSELQHSNWDEISQIAPKLSRGWFELSQLNRKDRIEFTREFWLSRFTYVPKFSEFLDKFFTSLDDIGIYLSQEKIGGTYNIEMTYALKRNKGFYRGAQPATEDEIIDLQKLITDCILPADYTAFLKIHNGFWKSTDSTGILSTMVFEKTLEKFQHFLESHNPVTTSSGIFVNPKSLIPFYESFGMPFYQCFWKDWYPEQQIGNVYYSGETNTISQIDAATIGPESLSFASFTDWLMFYLEQVE